jgi:hypothetical protein
MRSRLPPFDPVREGWSANGRRLPHIGALIAAFRRAACARCRAFTDEGRAVAAMKAAAY